MAESRPDAALLYEACRQDGAPAQAEAFARLAAYLYPVAFAVVRGLPAAPDVAADCAQLALIKVHRSLAQCREPAAFYAWAASIARRTALDAVRRAAAERAGPLPDDDGPLPPSAQAPPPEGPDELAALLRRAVAEAPLSDRSRRVVAGRFFEDRPDEDLARAESALAGQPVLPSHVQVTRAKNLAKLRADQALVAQLRAFLGDE